MSLAGRTPIKGLRRHPRGVPLRLGLRGTLLWSHLGLVLLAMTLAGLYILDQMERFHLAQLQTDLTVETTLVAEAAADALRANELGPLQQTLAAVDREGAVRIRVFDTSGRLVAATEAEDAPLVGQTVAAPGLAGALQGERTATIATDPAGPEVMYVAAPVLWAGQVQGAVRLAYALADVSAEVANLRRALLLGLTAGSAGAVALAVLLAGSLAAPARRLAQAARALAAGDLTARCEVRGIDEIAAAAHAFDEMATRLQSLESARGELMAAVAHDLNSTTMALGMAVEALDHGAADDPPLRAELLHGIEGHTRRLARLADDLLQTVQLETGSLRLEREPLAVGALLRQAAAEFAAEAAGRRVTLAVELTEPLALIEADPARLGQALANLVENALRHAPPGSTVHLQGWAVDGVVGLAVADEGPGFPVATASLGVGVRAHTRRTEVRSDQRPGRLGLGLSIVRGIAEAHGGRLELTSAPGAGARFALLLPMLPEDEPDWLWATDDGVTARGPARPDVPTSSANL